MKLKNIFTVKYNEQIFHVWLLVFRVLIGAFMLTHGLPKFQLLLSGQEILFPDPLGIGMIPSFFLLVFAEFLCAIFIIVGFGTRLSTIPVIISMIVAGLVFHGADPFSAKELSLVYLIAFASILVTGGGKYSIDYLISRKK